MCGESYCLDCKVNMHHGMSCIQFKADRVNKQDDSDVIKVMKTEVKAK